MKSVTLFCYLNCSRKNWFYDDMILLPCSGYGIAAQALTAIIRAQDGRGPQTMLTNSILNTLGLSSSDELIGYLSFEAYNHL